MNERQSVHSNESRTLAFVLPLHSKALRVLVHDFLMKPSQYILQKFRLLKKVSSLTGPDQQTDTG